jgi:hypothetical protein
MFKNFTKQNVVKWLRRYGYPLLFATLAEFLSALLAYHLSGDLLLSAAVATIVWNLVFFFFIVYKEVKERRAKDGRITLVSIIKVVRNLIIDFGPAEYLDGFLFRPFLLVIFPMFISPYFFGVIVGLTVAEIVYIAAVLVSYQTRKKLLKD